jgi:peptidoglycan/LPS O-acetylase OafA/YrhL
MSTSRAPRQHPDSAGRLRALPYVPALDGVRAVGVLLVIAFHFGVPHAHGGFLGVDVFFALSGFLITTILLGTGDDPLDGHSLVSFWLRRARRLLPALVVLIVVVTWVSWWTDIPGTFPTLRADDLAALFYVANWHLLHGTASYFAQFTAPSLLTHTWSLAIEEQFYVVWPLALVAVTRLPRLRRHSAVLVLGTVGAVASTLWGASLVHHARLNRLYYGTDTHLQGLMLGAAAAGAVVVAQRWLTPRVRQLLGVGGAVALVLLVWRATGTSPWLFRGGLLAVAAATVAIILAVSDGAGRGIGVVLGWRPMVLIGEVSYSLYLWHYPVLHWLTARHSGLHGVSLLAARLALTTVLAGLSFVVVERPIRRHAWRWRPALALTTVAAVLAGLTVGVAATGEAALPTYPEPAIVTPTHPTTVYVIGDSQALTLQIAVDLYAGSHGLRIVSGAALGCGLIGYQRPIIAGNLAAHNPACALHADGSFPQEQIWASQIAATKPNVILIAAGRWESYDLRRFGRVANITQASFRAAIRHTVRIIEANAAFVGARVAFATTPCTASGETPWGAPLVEDTPARRALYNALVRAEAARIGAAVYDLNARVCPDDHFTAWLDGRLIRTADGIHYAAGAGPLLGPSLMTWLAGVAAGR